MTATETAHKVSGEEILFVVGSLDIGGTEKQLLILARELQQRGWCCSLFSLIGHGPLSGAFQQAGVKLFDGGMQRGDLRRRPHRLLRAAQQLSCLIMRRRPQVLHAFLPLVTAIGALCGRGLRVPVVVTSRRGLSTHQDRYPFLMVLDRLATAMSHKVTVNSLAVQQDMLTREPVRPDKIALIYNGIAAGPDHRKSLRRADLRRQYAIHSHQKAIIVVANLIPYKGHRDFLQAFSRVIPKQDQALALLVGEDRGIGPELRAQARKLGVAQRLRWLGRRDDVFDLLRASDLSVICSHEEGFSNVVLESMAAALPVVATGVGGNSEAVINGQTGYLVPPHRPDLMASRILALLENPQRARCMGKRGMIRVQRLFSVQRMVSAHALLYRKCLKAAG